MVNAQRSLLLNETRTLVPDRRFCSMNLLFHSGSVVGEGEEWEGWGKVSLPLAGLGWALGSLPIQTHPVFPDSGPEQVNKVQKTLWGKHFAF